MSVVANVVVLFWRGWKEKRRQVNEATDVPLMWREGLAGSSLRFL